jgi:hypothetical protein
MPHSLVAAIGTVPRPESKRLSTERPRLRTTIKNPDAIETDKLNYITTENDSASTSANGHPGSCTCNECREYAEALMNWAVQSAAHQQAQAQAEAQKAAEEAQRRGDGPKPLMVTPYKHNWVISGSRDSLIDWDGVVADLANLTEWIRQPTGGGCCAGPVMIPNCNLM